jgi:hypothetical protein
VHARHRVAAHAGSGAADGAVDARAGAAADADVFTDGAAEVCPDALVVALPLSPEAHPAMTPTRTTASPTPRTELPTGKAIRTSSTEVTSARNPADPRSRHIATIVAERVGRTVALACR